MLPSDAANLVKQLVDLRDASTTLFLESMRSEQLQLQLESQEEKDDRLTRIVKLYFESPDLPVLYCKSCLSKHNLTREEYQSLTEGVLPIGVIFLRYNDSFLIKKTNITVTSEISSYFAALLNVRSPLVYKKGYRYWVGRRDIGYVSEYFNDESLQRI